MPHPVVPHVQATYVEAVRFILKADATDHDLGPGDSLIIRSGIRHGCICRAAGTLIDAFTPRCDDFR